MPSFISHIVMARDVYDKLNDKHINLSDMLTYSLGGDLSKYAKCRYDSHRKDMEKFIFEMANYIKDNDLVEDEHLRGVLYGHICHYVMDSIVHPLVYSTSKKLRTKKKNHTLLEAYYDEYLVNKRYHITRSKYLRSGILTSKRNSEVNMMINQVYLNIYDTDKVNNYYRINLFLYRRLRDMFIIFGDRLINYMMGLPSFIKKNKGISLISNDDDNLDILYEMSIVKAYEYIKKINKYLTNV